MKATARPPAAGPASAADRVEREAARWFARLAHAALDHPERGCFEAWLAASPRHAEEYARFDALWRDFDTSAGLRRLAGGVTARTEAKARSTQRRRVLQHGALGFVAICVTGLAGWRVMRREAAPLITLQHRSTPGQTLERALPDGSRVLLAPDSAFDLVYRADERQATLVRGEALFEIAHDATRPFTVRAGGARVVVLGTRFVVSRLGDDVRVSVLGGHVRFQPAAGDEGGSLVLVAGDVAQWRAAEPLRSPQLLQREAADALAWRAGSLVFSADTLPVVAEQLGRYTGIALDADALRASPVRITAVVQLRDAHAFVRSLPRLVPVRLEMNTGPQPAYRLWPR